MIILLDTSFLINLLSENAPFHERAMEFYAHFLKDKSVLKVSTIAISEYAVKDEVQHLPLRNLQILPFNFLHAEKSGLFGRISNKCRKDSPDPAYGRTMVLSDSKMFAQVEVEEINLVASADHRAMEVYKRLKEEGAAHFEYLDITEVDCYQYFGELHLVD